LTNQATYSEAQLVASLQDKDDRAFGYLYDNYAGALYSIVLQIVPDRDMASDVLQEVFLNIWRRIEQYDAAKGRLFTWMMNIARNAAIDLVRSKGYQKSQQTRELPETGESGSFGGQMQVNVDNIGLRKMLMNLKEEQRVLLDMAYFRGYTQDEIAKELSIPLGTVKTRMRTGLTQLKSFLK
jgi:RNA polymerase sigma-70 factor (ECF subfamily)